MSVHPESPALVRPFRFALLLLLGVVAVEALFGALLSMIAPDLSVTLVGIVTGGVLSIVAAVLLTWWGWWGKVGLLRGTSLWNIGLFWPLLLYGLLPLAQGFQTFSSNLDIGILAGALIAFWKIAVLGMFVVAFQHRGVWRATIFASTLFALMHLGGLLVGAVPLPTLLLSLSYLFLAFAFVSLRLRTGVLWPQLLIYTLFLIVGALLQPTQTPNLVPSVETLTGLIVITAILAVYGAIMLSRRPAPVPDEQDAVTI